MARIGLAFVLGLAIREDLVGALMKQKLSVGNLVIHQLVS